MTNNYKRNAKVFKALCDEKRLVILDHLKEGEKCGCVLIDLMDIGQSSLSYHMKILCESGIVESRLDGKLTLYRINNEGSVRAGLILKELTTPDENQTPNDEYFAKLKDPTVI